MPPIAQPIPQAAAPPPSGIGGLLSGVKNLWGQIGTDPALTRAAQVAAFSLLRGGGDTKRNIGNAGLAALQTLEATRAQQAATSQQAQMDTENKRRFEENLKIEQGRASEVKASRIIKGIYDEAELKARSDEAAANAAYRKKSLDIQEQELRARQAEATAKRTEGMTDRERSVKRNAAFLKQEAPWLDDVSAEVFGEDIAASRETGQPIDAQAMALRMTEKAIENSSLSGASIDTAVDESVAATEKILARLGQKGGRTRSDTRAAVLAAVNAKRPTSGPGAATSGTDGTIPPPVPSPTGAVPGPPPASRPPARGAFLGAKPLVPSIPGKGPETFSAEQAIKQGAITGKSLWHGGLQKWLQVKSADENEVVLVDEQGTELRVPRDQFQPTIGLLR